MAKAICEECKFFNETEYRWYCEKIKHPLQNGQAMLCHAELAGCYDENGELKSEQRKS
jgi:hypothetical protein